MTSVFFPFYMGFSIPKLCFPLVLQGVFPIKIFFSSFLYQGKFTYKHEF